MTEQSKRACEQSLTVTRIHNAINRTDRDVIPWAYVPGQSLAEIRSNLPSEVMFSVSLSGVTIPVERLSEVYPRPGDHILFVPVIAGGDDGKMIGRIIGMIVVAVLSFGIGAMAGAGMLGYSSAALAVAQGGMAGMMASAAVMMVGGLLVNALLPPPKPKMATLGNNFDNSQAYSWSPQSIQQQGVTVPRWYGRNRLYGNIIGGYLQSEGDKQIINALVALGTGPFFDIPATGMLINDQPYQHFNGVTITPRLGLLDQPVLDNFTDTIVEHNVSVKVVGGRAYKADTSYIVGDYVQYSGANYKCKLNSTGNLPTNTTYWLVETPVTTYVPSGTTFDGLEVEVDFSNGLFKVNNDGSYATQTVQVKVEITGPDGTFNLSTESNDAVEVIKTGWSLGYWQPIARTLLPSGTVYTQAWVEVTAGESEYTPAEIFEEVPVPYHNEGEVVGSAFWHYFGGGWGGRTLTAAISNSAVPYTTIISNTQKVVRKVWRKTGLTHGTWTVKVTRLTEDNVSTTASSDCYLGTVREIITQKFQYPRQVLCGINALATDQLSGSLRFSALCDCLYVRVYDSGTSTWSIKYSNNPAWVLFDLLTQPVYSGNATSGFTVVRYDGMDPSRLDLLKFVEWADWNNTLCPDGKGGTERRITFNGGFDSETNLWDAAMQVCQVGGAALVWNGVKLTLAIDKPSDPVQLFTVGNTGQDSFSESFLSMEDRAAEIECDFVNSEKDFVRDKLSVVNPNIKTITSKVNLPMFGVNKPSEVWRLARRRLAYNELISRTVSFNADIDAIACTVGDVVLLQSDVPQWGFGGRLVSATSTSVVLDQNVTLEVGKTYGILVRGGDDSIIERTITNAPGTTNTLTVSSAFTITPSPYDVYAFGESTIEAKPFRVTGIQRAGDLSAQINCIEYNESVYNTDLDLPVLPTINYSALESWPTITGLSVTERLTLKAGGGIETLLTVSYDAITDMFRFPKTEVLISEAGGPYLSKGFFTSNETGNLSTSVIDGVTYSVIVRIINSIGEYQPIGGSAVASITVRGLQVPPPPVDSFLFSKQPGGARQFAWKLTDAPLDVAGFIIRYKKGLGATWNDMLPLHNGVLLASPYETNQLSFGDYTFAISVIDTTGNLSTQVYIEGSVDDPRLSGVIQVAYPLSEGWPGVLTDCEVVSNALEAVDGGSWATLPDTWEAWTTWKTNPTTEITYVYEVADAGLICSFTPIIVVECAGEYTIEVATSDDNVTYSSWGSPTLVKSRYCKVRVVVTGSFPVIYNMSIYLDGKPIAEDIEDLDTSSLTGSYRIGAGDIRIPVQLTYEVFKTVQLALQNVGHGWSWELIDKNTTYGPRVKIYNQAGILSDCVIDASIKGI